MEYLAFCFDEAVADAGVAKENRDYEEAKKEAEANAASTSGVQAPHGKDVGGRVDMPTGPILDLTNMSLIQSGTVPFIGKQS